MLLDRVITELLGLDRELERELDLDTGINNCYVSLSLAAHLVRLELGLDHTLEALEPGLHRRGLSGTQYSPVITELLGQATTVYYTQLA